MRKLPLRMVILLLSISSFAQQGGTARIASVSDLHSKHFSPNPAPFQNHLASISGTVRFLLSPSGIELARNSAHPNLRSMLKNWGVNLETSAQPVGAAARSSKSQAAVAPALKPCNNLTGTQFNLEPLHGMPEIGFPVPQNEQAIDFIPGGGVGGADLVIGASNDYRGIYDALATGGGVITNAFGWGFSGTGYYVNRRGGCGADFEGGLPRFHYNITGEDLFGLGDPSVAANATTGDVYASDLRDGVNITALTLFRTTAGRLNNDATCPLGTHLTDANGNDTTASACWPIVVLLGTSDPTVSFDDKPFVRADERSQGVGAGDVYVVWTRFGFQDLTSSIELVTCTRNFKSLSDCSTPIVVSSQDFNANFPHIAILPSGAITVTYSQQNLMINSGTSLFETETVDLRHVTCTPAGAPKKPVCHVPMPIATEEQPLFQHITNSSFPVTTYPSHDVRPLANGQYEEIVVWDRCKQPTFLAIGDGTINEQIACPDADVLFTSSVLDAQGLPTTWTPVAAVNAGPGDQFFPWVAGNRSSGDAKIAYYSSQNDVFHHRLQLVVNTLRPGAGQVDAAKAAISVQNEPDADAVLGALFFGDYLGIASRGGRTYVHGTFNNFSIYGASTIPGQDNVLTNLDRLEKAP